MPTLQRLRGLFIARVFFNVRLNFFVDPDYWWHIKVGRDIWQTQYWPSTDIYSYTAYGTPWIAYEWLGEIMLARAASFGGIMLRPRRCFRHSFDG